MNDILEVLSRIFHQILGRATGPLNFRLVVMPIVVSVLAIRAHRRDVREGRSTALWAFIKDPAERRRLFFSGLRDFGKVFAMAIVLDTVYQVLVFRWVYPGEVLFIAVMCALVPYFLVRGPITRVLRLLFSKHAEPAAVSAGPTGSGAAVGKRS